MIFFKRERKIQFHIVSIFLVLLATSSLITIFYMYEENYQTVRSLADRITNEVVDNVVESVNDAATSAEFMTELTKGAIATKEIISEKDMLISYIINALNLNQKNYAISISSIDGSFISVDNVGLSKQQHYFLHPSEPLPQGVIYAIRIIDRQSSKATEKIQYLDTSGNVLATEDIHPLGYDPLSDPLFVNMRDWPHDVWSDVYTFGSGQKGVSISVPIFDPKEKFIGMVRTNLSLEMISNFVTHEKIGNTGVAFVLDSKGDILFPRTFARSQKISPAAFPDAYKAFIQNGENNFLLDHNNKKYFVTYAEYPFSLEQPWTVVVIIPYTDYFEGVIKAQHHSILVAIAILILFGFLVYLTGKFISKPIVQLAKDVDDIRRFNFEEKVPLSSNILEVNTLENSISSMRAALSSFTRYVPKDIVKQLIEKGHEIVVGGIRKELTVMFTDIENFTTYSESISIEELITSLTKYFNLLSKVILTYEGTIDKYIGDSVMAFWGAPNPIADEADKACLAALYFQESYKKEKDLPNWQTRIGIHSGETIVGNIGTNERLSYTAIGNVVNTTSRLQAINKDYKTKIVISQTVQEKIGTRFVTRPLDFVAFKGRKNRITIYELVAGLTQDPAINATKEQIELSKDFTDAYFLFFEGHFDKARELFNDIHRRFPEDYPTKLYLEKLKEIT